MRWRVAAAAALALSAVAPAAAGATTPEPQPTRLTTVRDDRITESSGLALSAARSDVVWTINDSGSAAVVYGVSTRTGRTVGVLRLTDGAGRLVDVVDTESLASASAAGRRSLLVGDIGDNRGVREHVTIWRVPEPSEVRDESLRATRLDVRYPGGPADAEALLATPDGRLIVITKALLRADVYEVPRAAVRRLLAGEDSPRPVTAQLVTRIAETLVTGADSLPDGRMLVRGYAAATLFRWSGGELVADEQVVLPAQQQGEAIAVGPGGRTAVVSSEGVRQPLWMVPLGERTVATQPVASPSPTPAATSPRARRKATDASPVELWALAVVAAGAATAAAVLGVRAARRRGRRRP